MRATGILAWGGFVFHTPLRPGIYSFWAEGKLLYIGTSECLKLRIRAHHLRKILMAQGADEIRFIFTKPETGKNKQRRKTIRLSMEDWLIKKHKPFLNQSSLSRMALRKLAAEASA